ncbi:GMC oxidoreductase [Thozetella sp. PMI_491]|nr:GMC oxidoreductase [Thozetella sp. PMI_491]
MRQHAFLALGLFALDTVAQQTTALTDEASGIIFQAYSATDVDFNFGIALPENPTTDFIGRISSNNLTDGWAAIDLGGNMVNRLLVVAWPNGDDVVSSLRVASSYANPDVYTNDTVSLHTIESGTSVNGTGFTYTFLCKGCITGDVLSFTSSASSTVFGYAVSHSALTDTADSTVALTYHSAGFGEYSADLTAAQSASYDTWAALASNATTGSGSGNGTTGGSAANITTTISNATYDHIVVGGGAAGLVVAERLAESGASVLLLERGGASTFSTGGTAVVDWNSTITQYDVPAMGYYLTTAADTSEYCTDTASMAGCILGGSTMVNAMMWVPPQAADFDDKWPAGWKWSDVESAASRLYESLPGTTLPSLDGQRYDQGAYDVLSQFLSSNGFKSVDAIEDPQSKIDVFSHPPWQIINAERGGPIRTHLPRAQAMSNFKLQLNSKVVRAVRNGSAITGVEVETSSTTRQMINLKAGGKVVLAAGSLSTPRILFNSGIGPSDQIQTVADGSVQVTLPDKADWIELPVGQGIQDHVIFTVSLSTKTTLSSLSQSAFTSPSDADVALYATGSGLLSQAGQRLNFWTSTNASDGITRYIQGTCNSPANDTIRIKVYLTHGLTSNGTLGITASGSTTLTTQPWLNTDGDKEAVESFLNRLIGFTQQSNSTLSLAGNATAASLMQDYTTGSHFVGSARMGTSNDGSSVVDTNTKVWGTDNLYIADASIHPDLPTGNTQAIVMVVAEQAAVKILGGSAGSNSTGNSTLPVGPSCKRRRRTVVVQA